MKKALVVLCVAALAVTVLGSAEAAIKEYQFSFTAADVLNYVIADGADGSTPAQNGLFDGARLKRNGLSGGAGSYRSYVTSQHNGFTSWANTTTDRMLSFNLWGLDGRGAGWGEDFKPLDWTSHTSSSGWTPYDSAWPSSWGAPPAGYLTTEIIGWDANSYGDGFTFKDSNLASQIFTFNVKFDTDNAFWGQDTNGAPNSLSTPELTFWVGGYFDNDYWGSDNSYYIYEGNMVLTGREVPEPMTIMLGILGLGSVAGLRRFKK
jgi:hypothetical protein